MGKLKTYNAIKTRKSRYARRKGLRSGTRGYNAYVYGSSSHQFKKRYKHGRRGRRKTP